MFRYSVAFILSIFIVLAKSPDAEAKYASIVVDAKTGRVLYSVNSNTKNYPASLTKIMTLFITFDALKSGLLSLGQKLQLQQDIYYVMGRLFQEQHMQIYLAQVLNM